ncbi:chloride channel protein [Cellulosimicrobium marinum]|uniref:chloride channel protein n=1 Tax=Cellulosimicrobium marinum TaxID=1638992 RepID=UPI001E3F155A|nr:chloride channel protein [Cellulosimicrobium marinum]MCB7136674.1 chloride channel protein [Cellulosimicrobium marinum]
MPDGAAPPQTAPADVGRLVLLAALVGGAAAVGATAFTSLVHAAEHLLWHTLPDAVGFDAPPWWWVVGLLVLGALGVAAASRLPGHGGHHPLDGLAFDITPRELGSTLLAAFSSLAFGAVIGPEAPLLAIGTSIGFAVQRRVGTEVSRVLVLSGAGAALGVVMGNPVVTALLVLEAALFAPPGTAVHRPLLRTVPLLVALGTGYLVRVGVGDWPGVHVSELSTGPLGTYTTVRVVDLLAGLATAALTTVVVVAALRGAEALRGLSRRHHLVVLVAGGAVVAAVALAGRAVTGLDVDVLLFSGQQSMPAVTGVTAAGTLVVVALLKALAYAVSLGSGFRGGAIFPAVFLGTAVGTLTSVVVPDTALAAQVACGIAAGTALALGMPVTALVLAVLLTASAGPAVTVPAIVGAVAGALVKAFHDHRRRGVDPDVADPGPADASADPAPGR